MLGQKVLIVHSSDDDDQEAAVKKINEQPSRSKKHRGNRYALKFFNETQEEILRKKEEARKVIIPVTITDLEIDSDSFFDDTIDFPKRPEWSYEMGREELEAKENRYFTVRLT